MFLEGLDLGRPGPRTSHQSVEDGNPVYYGYDHLCKYKDVVLFGAKCAKKPLSAEYSLQMKSFLDSLK